MLLARNLLTVVQVVVLFKNMSVVILWAGL